MSDVKLRYLKLNILEGNNNKLDILNEVPIKGNNEIVGITNAKGSVLSNSNNKSIKCHIPNQATINSYYSAETYTDISTFEKICLIMDNIICKTFDINEEDRINFADKGINIRQIYYSLDWIEKNKYEIRKLYFEEWFKKYFLDVYGELKDKDIIFYFNLKNYRKDITIPIISDNNFICSNVCINWMHKSYIPLDTFLLFSYLFNKKYDCFIKDCFFMCTYKNNDNEIEILFNFDKYKYYKDVLKYLYNINYKLDNVADEVNYYFHLDTIVKFLELDNFKYKE